MAKTSAFAVGLVAGALAFSENFTFTVKFRDGTNAVHFSTTNEESSFATLKKFFYDPLQHIWNSSYPRVSSNQNEKSKQDELICIAQRYTQPVLNGTLLKQDVIYFPIPESEKQHRSFSVPDDESSFNKSIETIVITQKEYLNLRKQWFKVLDNNGLVHCVDIDSKQNNQQSIKDCIINSFKKNDR